MPRLSEIPPPRPKDLSTMALNLASSALETPIEVGSSILDIISRPSYAVSEGLGAGRAGGGIGEVLGAGWRGLSGGRRRYASVGEQLFPESRVLGFAADVAADPLMFIPAAKVGRIAGGLVRGTKAGKAAGKGLRLAAKKFAESMPAKLILPLRSQMSLSNKYGKAIVLKAERAAKVRQPLENARREMTLIRKLHQLGLDNPKSADRRILAAQHVISGGTRLGKSTGDAQVDELAKFISREFADAAKVAKGEREIFPGFAKRELGDYFPQVLRDDVIDILERGNPAELRQLATEAGIHPSVLRELQRGPSMAAENLGKMLGISREEAEALWRTNTGRPMKAGHVEFKRMIDLSKYPRLLEQDPAKVLPRYFNQFNRRLAYAEEFGKDFEKLEELFDKARKAGTPDDLISDVRQAIRDPISPEGRILSKDWARKLLGAMVVTKMGITSTVANSSQTVNNIVVDGGTNFLRGVFRSRNPAARARATVSYHFNLKQQLEHFAGDISKPIVNLPLLRHITPERYLKATLFSPVETVNRILSATSGVTTAERLAQKAVKAGRTIRTRELTKWGVSREEFNFFRNFGRFSDAGIEEIGLRAANRTQHTTTYLDIPVAWRSPEMRLMTQYKSFIYQQSRFLTREVMKPAARYFAGHPDGDLKPLLRASVAFGIGGEAVASVRALLRGDDKRKFDSNHPLQQLFKDASYVGAFGMASDIVDSALRGQLGDYFLGPTFSEALDTATDITRYLSDPSIPTGEEVAEAVHRRIGRGPLPWMGKYLK